MGTLYDYMNWRGELSFTEAPFNEVDSLIFSLLSYLDLKGIVPDAHDGATVSLRAAANAFFSKNPDPRKISMGVIVPKNIIKVFRMAKDTRRFRNVGLKAHVNLIDIEKEEDTLKKMTSSFPKAKPKVTAARPTLGAKPSFNQQKRDTASFDVGMTVSHKTFGVGQIKSITGAADNRIAVVDFSGTEKKMFLAFAPLEIID